MPGARPVLTEPMERSGCVAKSLGCFLTPFVWALTIMVRGIGTVISWPFRVSAYTVDLYRRRISVQLISSHVLVVLLATFLLGATGLALVGGVIDVPTIFSARVDQQVFESQATTIADSLTPSDIARLSQASTSPTERAQVEAFFSRLVAPPNAGSDPGKLPVLNRALLVGMDGTVLASSDHGWIAPGARVATLRSPLLVEVVDRAIQLDGKPTGYGRLLVYNADRSTQVGAYPIISDGHAVAVVGTAGDVAHRVVGLHFSQIALTVVAAGFLTLIFASIPALLVSIPVGIWRARAVSKRLARLADAADAMARGDLDRRIEVHGNDEISLVSRRFNKMSASLAEADRSRKAFVANVSHELRTPLAIIQGNIERLQARRSAAVASVGGPESGTADSSAEEPFDPARDLSVIDHEVRTLRRLVDDLFTMARLEEAVLTVELAPVDVKRVADEAVEGISTLAWDQRKVTVQSMVPAGLPSVQADPTRLKQVFGNLLYNALRHTPEGGLIVVDAHRDGEAVEVSVADTGVGIPAADLELIFERFFQARNRAPEQESGGLGLAIVKQLIEAQGGTISVESVPDEGTVFRFHLLVAS